MAAEVYIRGAAPRAAGGRTVRRVTAAVLALVAVGVGAMLLAGLAADSARTAAVRARGVAVLVTVQGCVGLASGTGITEWAYRCRGRYVLDGAAHSAVLRGWASHLDPGRVVPAKVLPGDPASLTATAALTGG